MTAPIAFVALEFPPWLRWGQRRGAFIDNEALAAVYPDHKRHVRRGPDAEGAFTFVLVGAVRRCGWCGGECQGRRTAWCSDVCADRFYRVWSWGQVAKYVRERDGHRCTRCGTMQPGLPKNWNRGDAWDVDHIVSVRNGGTDDPANLRLLCADCHIVVGYEQRAAERPESAQTAIEFASENTDLADENPALPGEHPGPEARI